MKAPVVFTAGVKQGRSNKWTPKRNKNKEKNNDEEAVGKQSEDNNSPPAPTRDNRLSSGTSSATAANDDGKNNNDLASSSSTSYTDNINNNDNNNNDNNNIDRRRLLKIQDASVKLDDLYSAPPIIHDVDEDKQRNQTSSEMEKKLEVFWLAICFFGIMGSFVCYGLLLEYATSGGKHLHELSFLFVTSLLYTLTASVGRYARAEKPSTIPPAQFAVLGLTSMGSTFFSVRALRYVIYPIQVLAKSCKPVPVMLMGALMGKKYPAKKYVKVVLIVAGVGLFMGGGSKNKSSDDDEEKDASSQLIGVTLLFISLCFDGGTGAYEDKLMSVHSVGPFDLMYNIQLGKTILAGIGLIVLNQVHVFAQMCQDMGFLLVALGLSGAIGQVFIFITIAKFGALTCSIIGLARKVTTLVASIYFYGHHLNKVQAAGLLLAVGAMVNDFFGKKGGGGHGHGHGGGGSNKESSGQQQVGFKDGNLEEHQQMLPLVSEENDDHHVSSSLEMGQLNKN